MNCSIIVCTHNRAESLQRTILSLGKQSFPGGNLEIIIVDNASIDETRPIVARIREDYPFPLRYVFEPALKLSKARNRGLSVAQGEVVIFIDDDAIPRKRDWARSLAGAYKDPAVGAAGGDAYPVWPDGKAPAWLPGLLSYNLGITRFNRRKIIRCRYPNYPFGVNISFRAESVRQLEGFSNHLGRAGDRPLAGEEQELCMRLEKAGLKVLYVPHASVDHFIRPEKLTRRWFESRSRCEGENKAFIESFHSTSWQLIIRLTWRLFVLGAGILGSLAFSLLGERKLLTLHRCEYLLSRAYLARMRQLLSRAKGSDQGNVKVDPNLSKQEHFQDD